MWLLNFLNKNSSTVSKKQKKLIRQRNKTLCSGNLNSTSLSKTSITFRSKKTNMSYKKKTFFKRKTLPLKRFNGYNRNVLVNKNLIDNSVNFDIKQNHHHLKDLKPKTNTLVFNNFFKLYNDNFYQGEIQIVGPHYNYSKWLNYFWFDDTDFSHFNQNLETITNSKSLNLVKSYSKINTNKFKTNLYIRRYSFILRKLRFIKAKILNKPNLSFKKFHNRKVKLYWVFKFWRSKLRNMFLLYRKFRRTFKWPNLWKNRKLKYYTRSNKNKVTKLRVMRSLKKTKKISKRTYMKVGENYNLTVPNFKQIFKRFLVLNTINNKTLTHSDPTNFLITDSLIDLIKIPKFRYYNISTLKLLIKLILGQAKSTLKQTKPTNNTQHSISSLKLLFTKLSEMLRKYNKIGSVENSSYKIINSTKLLYPRQRYPLKLIKFFKKRLKTNNFKKLNLLKHYFTSKEFNKSRNITEFNIPKPFKYVFNTKSIFNVKHLLSLKKKKSRIRGRLFFLRFKRLRGIRAYPKWKLRKKSFQIQKSCILNFFILFSNIKSKFFDLFMSIYLRNISSSFKFKRLRSKLKARNKIKLRLKKPYIFLNTLSHRNNYGDLNHKSLVKGYIQTLAQFSYLKPRKIYRHFIKRNRMYRKYFKPIYRKVNINFKNLQLVRRNLINSKLLSNHNTRLLGSHLYYTKLHNWSMNYKYYKFTKPKSTLNDSKTTSTQPYNSNQAKSFNFWVKKSLRIGSVSFSKQQEVFRFLKNRFLKNRINSKRRSVLNKFPNLSRFTTCRRYYGLDTHKVNNMKFYNYDQKFKLLKYNWAALCAGSNNLSRGIKPNLTLTLNRVELLNTPLNHKYVSTRVIPLIKLNLNLLSSYFLLKTKKLTQAPILSSVVNIAGLQLNRIKNFNSGFTTQILPISTKFNRNLTGKRQFIFRNIGLFLTNKFLLNKFVYRNFSLKFRFKKIYYSFVYPDKVKRSAMILKKSIVVSRFFKKYSFKSRAPKWFKTKNIKQIFSSYYTSFFNLRGLRLDNALMTSMINPIVTTQVNIYKDDFMKKGYDTSFRFGEVAIPRIRFKPGYQRLWRRARLALQEIMSTKFRYQYRLTRHLLRFATITKDFFLSFKEATLRKMVMFSRLLPDDSTFNLFLTHNLIFLNGKEVVHTESILYVNDFIQLNVSIWYYIFNRWLVNWTTLRVRKLRKLIYRKNLAVKKKLMKLKKQRSNYTPNWIFTTNYDISDIKSYLEVDYLTLSAYVIYDYTLLNFNTFTHLYNIRQNIYRLYNWKYIT